MKMHLVLLGLVILIALIGFLHEPTITGKAVVGCESHSYKECHENEVYWYDSCGNVEEVDPCSSREICKDASCECRTGYIKSDGECQRTL
ncbi:MAG: hypothetical protein ACLFP2_06160 [Candidatus Woesearchaeota archaeon]